MRWDQSRSQVGLQLADTDDTALLMMRCPLGIRSERLSKRLSRCSPVLVSTPLTLIHAKCDAHAQPEDHQGCQEVPVVEPQYEDNARD